MNVTLLGHEELGIVTPSPEFGDGHVHTAPAHIRDHKAVRDFTHEPIESPVTSYEDRRMAEGGATVFSYQTRFNENGGVQESTLILPDDLKTEVPVAISLPWMVSDRGIMRGVAQRLVEGGIAAVIFKPYGRAKRLEDQGFDLEEALSPKITIAQKSYNQQRALDTVLPNHPELSPDLMIATGPSKGGPESMAMAIPKYARGRKVLLVDAVAPAPADRYTDADFRKLPRIIVEEAIAIGGRALLRVLDPRFWLHDRKTFELSSDFWRGVHMNRNTLFNGDPGAVFRATDPETQVHLDLHAKDEGCMPQRWQSMAMNRGNTSVAMRDDLRHMDIPRRLPFAVARIIAAIDQSKDGKDFSHVDFEAIKDAAPAQKPLSVPFPKLPWRN